MDEYAKQVASNAQRTGQDSINSFNPSATASNQLSAYNSLNAQQFGQSSDYAKRFANTISSNPSATDYYQQGNQAYNVQPLMDRANYLNTQVTNAYPSAVQQARGYDYSQGQIDNTVNQNLRFLQPQATAATGQAQVAQQLAAGYADRGLQQTDINLRPITAEGQFIQSQQNNQATNMTTTQTNELAGLQAKMTQGVQLSAQETQRYQALLQLQGVQATANAAIQEQQLRNQFANLAAGNTLVNTFTGGTYRAK